MNEDDLNKAFQRFKNLADKKKTITDADLEAMLADEFYQPTEVFTLDDLEMAPEDDGLETVAADIDGETGADAPRRRRRRSAPGAGAHRRGSSPTAAARRWIPRSAGWVPAGRREQEAVRGSCLTGGQPESCARTPGRAVRCAG